MGSTAFLYQVNRPGWSFIVSSIDDMVEHKGATHLVATAKDDDIQKAMQKYTVLVNTPTFVIVDLTRKNPSVK
jgi:hypothetical protein